MRVLVIGAGPGGAAAATDLARGGADVLLIERSRWPREKTCGDGLSPPGVAASEALGVGVADHLHLAEGEIETPGGIRYRSGWRAETPWGTVIRRREFDARIVELAVGAGAAFEPQTAAREIDLAGGKPRVRLGERGADTFDGVVLAEGATGMLAPKLGFGKHRSRLVAVRGYARARRALEPLFGLYFPRLLAPGYGWIFPLDERRANVGVLVDERLLARRGKNVRALLAEWLRSDVALDAVDAASLEDVSGGVIPTGRPRRARDGVLLVGDAAGVADPFSAEGISQAIDSGRAAARALLEHGGDQARTARAYRRALAPFDRNERESRRFRLGFGLVIDPLARRAVTRPALAHHLGANGMFMKESLPAFLWGIVRTW